MDETAFCTLVGMEIHHEICIIVDRVLCNCVLVRIIYPYLSYSRHQNQAKPTLTFMYETPCAKRIFYEDCRQLNYAVGRLNGCASVFLIISLASGS